MQRIWLQLVASEVGVNLQATHAVDVVHDGGVQLPRVRLILSVVTLRGADVEWRGLREHDTNTAATAAGATSRTTFRWTRMKPHARRAAPSAQVYHALCAMAPPTPDSHGGSNRRHKHDGDDGDRGARGRACRSRPSGLSEYRREWRGWCGADGNGKE